MPTFTATRGATNFVPQLSTGAGVVHAAYGRITLPTNPAANDILEFCWLPAGVTVLSGWFRGDDLDTGTETLDIDIGWAANGVEAADTDGFGNFGVLDGDVVSQVKPEVSIMYTLNNILKSGPVSFTNQTRVTGIVNATAATFATGSIWVCLLYVKTDTLG